MSWTRQRALHIDGAGHAAFAVTMIGLGVLGLLKSDFTVVWQPVPKGVPAREALAYLCAFVSLASGVGLLWRRTAPLAAGALLLTFIVWFLLWRIRPLFNANLIESTWSCGETLVLISAAWVLFASFAAKRLSFVTSGKGLRIARTLYGLGLIPFGYAHFANVKGTTVLIPGWLPWHVFCAYLTGVTFIAAGVAVIVGVFARLAASLSALQMGMFALVVWVPIVARGNIGAFQWGEFVTTLVLTAAAWVVADSYRGTPWLTMRKR